VYFEAQDLEEAPYSLLRQTTTYSLLMPTAVHQSLRERNINTLSSTSSLIGNIGFWILLNVQNLLAED
jgi:cyanate permease